MANEDESWSDLAAELGLGQTTPPRPAPEPDAGDADELDTSGSDGPDAYEAETDDTVVIPSLSGEPVSEGEAGDAGQRGRKRRRRRRKKRGTPADAADSVNGPATATADDGDDEDDDEDDELGRPTAVADDVPAEAARDVIANWNVPSWEDIIAGLYRPDR